MAATAQQVHAVQAHAAHAAQQAAQQAAQVQMPADPGFRLQVSFTLISTKVDVGSPN